MREREEERKDDKGKKGREKENVRLSMNQKENY